VLISRLGVFRPLSNVMPCSAVRLFGPPCSACPRVVGGGVRGVASARNPAKRTRFAIPKSDSKLGPGAYQIPSHLREEKPNRKHMMINATPRFSANRDGFTSRRTERYQARRRIIRLPTPLRKYAQADLQRRHRITSAANCGEGR
jgi:hypothetical protein